jgi:hypothetical protein
MSDSALAKEAGVPLFGTVSSGRADGPQGSNGEGYHTAMNAKSIQVRAGLSRHWDEN